METVRMSRLKKQTLADSIFRQSRPIQERERERIGLIQVVEKKGSWVLTSPHPPHHPPDPSSIPGHFPPFAISLSRPSLPLLPLPFLPPSSSLPLPVHVLCFNIRQDFYSTPSVRCKYVRLLCLNVFPDRSEHRHIC